MTALPAALRNRYNQRTGAAAEEAFVAELRQRFGNVAVWRPGANASARHNADVWDLWDIIAISPWRLTVVQVKATAEQPRLDRVWLERYREWPHPESALCLLAWLRPEGTWQVWLIGRDGRLVDAGWRG